MHQFSMFKDEPAMMLRTVMPSSIARN